MIRKKCILFLLASFCLNAFAQSGETKLLSAYDANTDTNLALYNGKLNYFALSTPDPRINNQFLQDHNDYSKGDIHYDGQSYFDADLKYDIFNDILLVRPKNDAGVNVELIQAKVSEFHLLGKNFVNVEISDGKTKFSGYLERSVSNDRFTFYIKHKKSVRQVIYQNRKVSDFQTKNEFYVLTGKSFMQISTKSHVTEQFPDQREAIDMFYKTNKVLLKTNETTFMEKLFRQLEITATK